MIEEIQKKFKNTLYTKSIEEMNFLRYRDAIAQEMLESNEHNESLRQLATAIITVELSKLAEGVFRYEDEAHHFITGLNEDEYFIEDWIVTPIDRFYFVFKRPKCEHCKAILYNAPFTQEYCEDCEYLSYDEEELVKNAREEEREQNHLTSDWHSV